jgi:PiT family inorganic phosphate transporter
MTLLLTIIALALVFDYINGFHDAANAIATVVATKVLSPFQAVIWAAFFNFLAYWVFGFGVADTVAKTANTMEINLVVILAGVIAAIIWNLLTWWFGIPSSSSHTLIGGFAGAAIAHAGLDVVNWYKAGKAGELPTGVLVIIGFIVLAPLIGAIVSYCISIWLLHSSKKSIGPKIFTLALMIGTVVLVYSQMIPYDKIHKPRFDSHFWSVAFEAHNIKWFLVAFIVLSVSLFCLIFSFLSHHQSTKWLRKMQLLSSAAFSGPWWKRLSKSYGYYRSGRGGLYPSKRS